MRDEINSEAWGLRHGQLLALEALEGRILCVSEGQVWLTEEGVGEDVILAAGDCYRVRGAGKLLVEAARQASLRVLPPVTRPVVPRVGLAA